jgi:hypothetical protein
MKATSGYTSRYVAIADEEHSQYTKIIDQYIQQEMTTLNSARGESHRTARVAQTISQKEYMEPVKAVVYGLC